MIYIVVHPINHTHRVYDSEETAFKKAMLSSWCWKRPVQVIRKPERYDEPMWLVALTEDQVDYEHDYQAHYIYEVSGYYACANGRMLEGSPFPSLRQAKEALRRCTNNCGDFEIIDNMGKSHSVQ